MTKIIAHRGASAIAPENTMPAFKKAIEMGCKGIETDVHMTKDGVLVLCHDEKVDRTTDGKGFIKDYTLKELKKLDAGVKFSHEFAGVHIPTLEELLIYLFDKDIYLNIEIKLGGFYYPDIEAKVLELLYKYNYVEKTIISSFNHYSLVEVRKLDSDVKTAILYMEGLYKPWEYAKTVGANMLHPCFEGVNREIIQEAKINKMPITVFTVDERKEIERFISYGVYGIITNYPDRVMTILKNKK
ncbi:glycerophosphoryl diester phosphodiesterase [Anaerobranca californiensis DSM 14826]|jgi:glycerophosphoryl diester phosphodiesterase|uniref:Glycerophosphoryl diester phosphodiesterase n=1 Tax=Anaerobranca californiensis DSM 14826 TaxID=1120989 RepID=A0A1M6MM03_9FIRM|nr:glycerophosphodiester phosphodiesterase [Anaerobranca californiensis]SHJ84479.1 glycerophosphoryl diester phosphodiesterase [Anaerobranca californiensis DSM 14826]